MSNPQDRVPWLPQGSGRSSNDSGEDCLLIEDEFRKGNSAIADPDGSQHDGSPALAPGPTHKVGKNRGRNADKKQR